MYGLKRYEFIYNNSQHGSSKLDVSEFVKFEDYEKLQEQLGKAEAVLKYISEGEDHWAEAEQLAAREYFKEKEQV